MADIKEETPVEKTEQTQEEGSVQMRKRNLDPEFDRLRFFYEKNKKAVTYAGGGLAVLIAAFLYFRLFYLPEQEKEAANEMFWAQEFFEKDSFNIALHGGPMVMSPDGQKQMLGFEQVAEDYGVTKTGNLANYYAGICYLRTGKFEQAIEYLNNYDVSDGIVGPIAIGAIGDCHMELNRADEAVKYYVKAADKSANSFTTPYFLKKAAFAYEVKGDYTASLEMYHRLNKEYPNSEQSREVQKDIARVKELGNI